MPTLRDEVLPIIDSGWALVDELGFAPYQVTVRVRRWTGGDNGPEVGLGQYQDTDTTLTPNYQAKEINAGGGLHIGPITPAYGGVGWAYSDLNPTLQAGEELLYIVTGPHGTYNYSLHEIDTSDPVEYHITLNSLHRPAPV